MAARRGHRGSAPGSAADTHNLFCMDTYDERPPIGFVTDQGIETEMFICKIFHLPLRQSIDFIASIARVMKTVIRPKIQLRSPQQDGRRPVNFPDAVA
jgi:hypothetical protein